MKSLVIINFKTYEETIGDKSLALAKKIAKVKKNGYEIVVAPSLLTMKEVADKTNLTVFAQHVDPVLDGSSTGSIAVGDLKAIGAKGVILNHSEKKLPFKILKETIKLCRQKALITVVCASKTSEIKMVAQLNPDYVAYEPKELIGGDVSVTKARPHIIVKAVETVKSINKNIKVLVGAGVHSQEDLGLALLLGAHGVLIGHAVLKANNPNKFLEEMLL